MAREEPPRAICPFCAAPWTDAMLEHFDAMSSGGACGCCVPGGAAVVSWPLAPAPVSDLCCSSCGKAIYRKA